MERIYRKLQKIGGSLVISLPKKWAENYQLKAGSPIGIEVLSDSTLSLILTAEEEEENIEFELSRFFYFPFKKKTNCQSS